MPATIGQMRERIQILKPVFTTKPTGQRVATGWDIFLETWARTVYSSGGEAVEADQVQASRTWKITTRYFEGLDPKDRITLGGKTLEVLNYGWDERKTRLEIDCTEAN